MWCGSVREHGLSPCKAMASSTSSEGMQGPVCFTLALRKSLQCLRVRACALGEAARSMQFLWGWECISTRVALAIMYHAQKGMPLSKLGNGGNAHMVSPEEALVRATSGHHQGWQTSNMMPTHAVDI